MLAVQLNWDHLFSDCSRSILVQHRTVWARSSHLTISLRCLQRDCFRSLFTVTIVSPDAKNFQTIAPPLVHLCSVHHHPSPFRGWWWCASLNAICTTPHHPEFGGGAARHAIAHSPTSKHGRSCRFESLIFTFTSAPEASQAPIMLLIRFRSI